MRTISARRRWRVNLRGERRSGAIPFARVGPNCRGSAAHDAMVWSALIPSVLLLPEDENHDGVDDHGRSIGSAKGTTVSSTLSMTQPRR